MYRYANVTISQAFQSHNSRLEPLILQNDMSKAQKALHQGALTCVTSHSKVKSGKWSSYVTLVIAIAKSIVSFPNFILLWSRLMSCYPITKEKFFQWKLYGHVEWFFHRLAKKRFLIRLHFLYTLQNIPKPTSLGISRF